MKYSTILSSYMAHSAIKTLRMGGKNLFSFLEPVFFAENVLQKCVVFNNQGILSIKKVAAHFIDKL